MGKRVNATRRGARFGVWLLAALTLTPLTLAGTGSPAVAHSDPDHLALTPPMGWSNWDAFSPKTVTEEHIRAITDKMAALGMRDVGYEYVIVGAGWQADARAANGEMQADGTKFPGGMKALADYVHSQGLQVRPSGGAGYAELPGVAHAGNRHALPAPPMPTKPSSMRTPSRAGESTSSGWTVAATRACDQPI